MHPDFIDAAVAPAEGVEKRHITEVEGAISSSLINTGIMVNEECRDYQRKRVNHFWKVQMVNESRDISDSQLRVSYKISEILGTNSFLIIATQSGSFQCPCDETKSFSSRECVRPCSVPFSYDECTGVDSAADSSVSVCPPKSPSLSIPSKTSNPGTGFAPCFNIDCSSNTQKRDCFGLVGCEWCSDDYAAGSPLPSPYCEKSQLCLLGSKGSPGLSPSEPTIGPSEEPAKEGLTLSAILGIVAGAIFAVILCGVFKRKQQGPTAHNERRRAEARRQAAEREQRERAQRQAEEQRNREEQQAGRQESPSSGVASLSGGEMPSGGSPLQLGGSLTPPPPAFSECVMLPPPPSYDDAMQMEPGSGDVAPPYPLPDVDPVATTASYQFDVSQEIDA
eukprot:m.103159 g.103159  ORF g.103159 m.103159 type:complete len:393 (+) comp37190_c0_seq15:2750-3928(+)